PRLRSPGFLPLRHPLLPTIAPAMDPLSGLGRAAAEMLAHHLEQVLHPERLGQVVVRSALETALALVPVRARSKKNERNRRRTRIIPQRGEHFVAVHLRHPDIADDEIRAAV